MKQRNTDIDWIRAILIILMILIHIVSFGNAYPQLKAGILSFMMPTFLIITGYLVNIEKSPKEMGIGLTVVSLFWNREFSIYWRMIIPFGNSNL